MNKQKDPGKYLFEMMGFQYKPLEKELLKVASEDFKEKYLKASFMVKIRVLDKFAQKLGY